ncbi:hypothetical protein WISP_51908 [Willisornis vidua]|uniref:Uncharacterized protein n=1 Tax=Willisornis vidua TaxID=1566151 RepID=A0ABQ9DE50_9PASS|nr:hypothetical protein WISP_51908 [Willisornis vidua]
MAGAESGMSGAGIPQQPQPQPQPPAAAAGPADESSDSEGEHEGPQKLIRKVSTSGQIRSKASEGCQISVYAPDAALQNSVLLLLQHFKGAEAPRFEKCTVDQDAVACAWIAHTVFTGLPAPLGLAMEVNLHLLQVVTGGSEAMSMGEKRLI